MSRSTDVAGYGYLVNSPLVGQIDFTNSGAWRMATSKQYDHLNRLLQIAAALYTSSAVSSAYVRNDANQRIQATLADRSGSDLCIVHLRLT